MGTTSQTIFWIDSDCHSLQNDLTAISLNFNFNLERFTTVSDGINRIKEIKWRKIYVIIRGSMIRDLISAIILNKKEFYCSLDIIIFTLHKEDVKRLCQTDELISSSGYIFN